ncbi:MAG: ParB/RepB/Spo0J family partition protein [candidate division Zixibacteria bacterium]|nr:ParB/RepB/Spo0J family partition protein [candidate division Zixibacteria bacterium]
MKAAISESLKVLDIEVAQITPTQKGERTRDVASLAQSIKAVGLMVPVIVRPLPDGSDKKSEKPLRYQLVDGHRRLAAVKVNKAQTIRAIEVDPLTTDDQVGMLQLTANLHRLQLTPFEEAEAIAKLRKAGRTTEEIAADLGLRPQLIARREKLNDLIPGWMKRATQAEHPLSIAAAELLAVFDASVQGELLKRYQWGSPDVRSLKEHLAEMTNRLKAAPWDLSDSMLVPEAGACSACPKRSACQPLLFHDETDIKKINAADRCLDEKCWNKKRNANFKKALDAATEKYPGLIYVEDKKDHGEIVPALKDKSVLSHWKFQIVRTADKHSTPALIANGPRAGTVVHVKIEKAYQGDRKVKAAAAAKKPKGLSAEQDRKARRAKFIINKIKDHYLGMHTLAGRKGPDVPQGVKKLHAEDRLKILAAVAINCCNGKTVADWKKLTEFTKLPLLDATEKLWALVRSEIHIPVYSFADAFKFIEAIKPFAETVLDTNYADIEAEALKAIPDPKPKAGATGKKAGKK